MLLAFCNPPATVDLDILVIVTYCMEGHFVLAVLFDYEGSYCVADTSCMSVVNEVHYLLPVLVERFLCGAESLVLCNHVVDRTDIHSEFVAEIHFEFEVGTENFNIVVLIVLVTFSSLSINKILEHYAISNSVIHIDIVLCRLLL